MVFYFFHPYVFLCFVLLSYCNYGRADILTFINKNLSIVRSQQKCVGLSGVLKTKDNKVV